jgi:hypothetical protein
VGIGSLIVLRQNGWDEGSSRCEGAVLMLDEKFFGSSLAAATFLAVGDGEDAAPGTWGSWEGYSAVINAYQLLRKRQKGS